MRRLNSLKSMKSMNSTNRTIRIIRILAAVFVMIALVVTMAMPIEVHAASKKTKTKYSISVTNINSNTVIKKGTKLKIAYKATKKKKGKVSGTKVKFKSSNKKVATVSKKGVIKAKKKGTVKITVYCKAKPSKKKTIKIRVGTPVSSIKVSGSSLLHKGYSTTFKASANSGATNKTVKWSSSNAAVATVNSSGKVTGKSVGTATIYASAVDGSGVVGARDITVYKYSRDSANWVAHRGLHTSATENTAAAFEAAGNAGFRAVECDVWETKNIVPARYTLPEKPEGYEPPDPESSDGEPDASASDDSGDHVDPADPEIAALITAIDSIDDDTDVIDQSEAVKDAKNKYDALIADMTDVQKYEARLAIGDDRLNKLFDAIVRVGEYESFDIVINHDDGFERTMGYDKAVTETTIEEIESNSRLKNKVCFFDKYLEICLRYNMTPYVEIKNTNASDMAIKKIIDKIYDADGTGDLLERTRLISFYDGRLNAARDYAKKRLGGTAPYTAYLVNSDVSSKISLAKSRGYSAIGLKKDLMSDSVWSQCVSSGLRLGIWTYKDNETDILRLQDHLLSGKYSLDFATVDFKPY